MKLWENFVYSFSWKGKLKVIHFNNQKLFSTDNHVRVWVTSHANAYPIFQFDISCSTLFSSRFHPIHWINNKAPSDPSLLFLYKSHCIWKFGAKDKLKEKKNTNWYLSEEFQYICKGCTDKNCNIACVQGLPSSQEATMVKHPQVPPCMTCAVSLQLKVSVN